MGAWKLRAIVYGLLACVAGLVLWQSGALADEPDQPRAAAPPKPFVGLLPGGGRIVLYDRPDGRLQEVRIIRLPVRCERPARPWTTWFVDVSKEYHDVEFRQTADRISLYSWPDPTPRAWISVDARVLDGGTRFRGEVHVMEDRGRDRPRTHCEGHASFDATR
jgi:hypothetical protein